MEELKEQVRKIVVTLSQQSVSNEYNITIRDDLKKRWLKRKEYVDHATSQLLALFEKEMASFTHDKQAVEDALEQSGLELHQLKIDYSALELQLASTNKELEAARDGNSFQKKRYYALKKLYEEISVKFVDAEDKIREHEKYGRTLKAKIEALELKLSKLKEDAAHKEMDWFTSNRRIKTLELKVDELKNVLKGYKAPQRIIDLERQLSQQSHSAQFRRAEELEKQLAKAREGYKNIKTMLEKTTTNTLLTRDEREILGIATSTLKEIRG